MLCYIMSCYVSVPACDNHQNTRVVTNRDFVPHSVIFGDQFSGISNYDFVVSFYVNHTTRDSVSVHDYERSPKS